MEYSNEYACDFSDKNFGKDIKGLNNLYADGRIPDGSKRGDLVFGKDGKPVLGTTHHRGFRSDVYLYKAAFISPRQLYLIMGHEYIHVAHRNARLINDYKSEYAAYSWTIKQAEVFGFLVISNSKYLNIRYYDAAYEYTKFQIRNDYPSNVLP